MNVNSNNKGEEEDNIEINDGSIIDQDIDDDCIINELSITNKNKNEDDDNEQDSKLNINNNNSRNGKTHLTIKQRVDNGEFMKIAAPMVRFSRLPFRLLCQKWGCDITYSPMFLADAFNRSAFARDSEFTTNSSDSTLIVQFAANSAEELSSAAEKVAYHCQGIDVNCGCPQKWVMKEGLGANLLLHPEKIEDMIKQTKRRITLMNQDSSPVPLSIKIRIQPDMNKTIELVRRAQMAGVDWIAVHGRTSAQRSTHPVDYDAIKLVKEHAQIPIFANGDIFTLDQALEVGNRTKVNGVMSARGILCNPALYKGYDQCPPECVMDFVDIFTQYGGLHQVVFHRHLMYMMYQVNNRNEKVEFNRLTSTPAILDYIKDKYYFP